MLTNARCGARLGVPGRALKTPVKFDEKLRTMALWNSRSVYLFTIKFLLPLAERSPILCTCSWDVFPCDTRLEAFPPYLSRVSSLTRLLSSKKRISPLLFRHLNRSDEVSAGRAAAGASGTNVPLGGAPETLEGRSYQSAGELLAPSPWRGGWAAPAGGARLLSSTARWGRVPGRGDACRVSPELPPD